MIPTEEIAKEIFQRMYGEPAIGCFRYTASNQNYVYGIDTGKRQYVLRLTLPEKKELVLSALNLQSIMEGLDVPISKFIKEDLDGKHSPFLSLLMNRMPGQDIIHIYSQLNTVEKLQMAKQIYEIQKKTTGFMMGSGYGRSFFYNNLPTNQTLFTTWSADIFQNIHYFIEKLHKTGLIHIPNENKIYSIMDKLKANLDTVLPTAFLRDIGERNVLVKQGRITGVIDIDDICFGDSLLVIALTHIALREKGYDTEYTDAWQNLLNLDSNAQDRLELYKIFYALSFLRLHGQKTTNNQDTHLNTNLLLEELNKSINYF